MRQLASRTGRSVDDLTHYVDDVARPRDKTVEPLAQRLTASPAAMDVISQAADPAVQTACRIFAGRVVPNPTDPGVLTWLQRINFAYQRSEPMQEACEVAGKVAGVATGP